MDARSVCLFPLPRVKRAGPLLLLAALAPLLSGCAAFERRWPPQAGGGFGELAEIEDERARLIEARLLEFDARGARRFAAAEYDEAAQLFVRVRRELVAEHLEDAALDMDRVDELAARIEKRLRSARR
jgi:hypothetical protein